MKPGASLSTYYRRMMIICKLQMLFNPEERGQKSERRAIAFTTITFLWQHAKSSWSKTYRLP
jgi:hypothetical protein